jgi:HD-like signal output (HDOD) protein
MIRPTPHKTRGTTIAIALTVAFAIAACSLVAWRVFRTRSTGEGAHDSAASGGEAPARAEGEPLYSTDVITAVFDESFKIAFGIARFDYQIVGEHAAVLERVDETVARSVHQSEYFPRRPMLLPKLLQALNDDDSSRQALVKVILEDPALAGSVLKRANSAFYRVSPEPVESLDRAVVVLGTEGLKSLMAIAILQPVFRQPKGYFDNFATLTWEQAQRTAVAAETCAKSDGGCDPFVAQLLGLLGALARIVIFRLTIERYRERPNILPRAEVFIRSMQKHGPGIARLVASTWELSDISLKALDEQQNRISPAHMSPLGAVVYFGELCGALALLNSRRLHSTDGAQALLLEQGLRRETVYAMWRAALSVSEER